MHISSKTFALAGAAMALAMTPAIAGAQDGATSDGAAQDTAASMLQTAPAPQILTPADQEQAMLAWPPATQEYYKALTAERQQMFWALTDKDKVRLSALPEQQRETAWAQIAAQFPPRG